MKRGIIATLLIVLLVPGAAQGGPPTLVWQKTYGGSNYDTGTNVIRTGDGGYLIVGHTKSSSSGEQDIFVVKTDGWGNKEWEKRLGGEYWDWGYAALQTVDGGFVIVGATFTATKQEDALLIKLTQNGVVEWEKKFGGDLWDIAFSLIQTSDGGYAIVGYTGSYGENKGDVWLIKTDRFGDEEWSKTYPGSERDAGYSIIQTADGGYAVAGFTSSKGNGGKDAWLLKINAWGNVEWDKTYGGAQDDVARHIIQTADNGYLLVGWTSSFGSGSYDVWIAKIASSGNLEWQKSFGGPDVDQGYQAMKTEDGGYIITGFTRSFGSGAEDAWLLKIDSKGNEEWNRTFGGPLRDEGYSLVVLDNACVVAGLTFSFGAGSGDMWIFKAGPQESIPSSEEETGSVFPLIEVIYLGVGVGVVGGTSAAIMMHKRKSGRKVGEIGERLMKLKKSPLAEAVEELKRKKEGKKTSPLTEAMEKLKKKRG
ncbi:MAG: hypothetical protein QXH08_03540 [Candidatus Hadarchaeales archaeon]